jgi:hypothetical protein
MGLIPMVSLCTCQRTVSLISCPFPTISNHRILYKTLSLLTLHLHILDCSRWASSICDHPFIHRQISGQVSRDARQRPLRGTSKTSPTNVEESWLFPPVLLFPINIARSMSLTLSRPFTIETYDPPSTRQPPSYDYIHAFDLRTDSSPRGQVLGSKPKERRSTPPDSQPSNNLDRTPP